MKRHDSEMTHKCETYTSFDLAILESPVRCLASCDKLVTQNPVTPETERLQQVLQCGVAMVTKCLSDS